MPSPILNHDLRLGPIPEPFQAQTFIAKLSVEGFVRTVLPRFARINQRSADVRLQQPLQHGVGDEFRTVVRAQVLRRTVLTDQLRQHLDEPSGADAAGHIDRQSLPGVLIDEGEAQALQC